MPAEGLPGYEGSAGAEDVQEAEPVEEQPPTAPEEPAAAVDPGFEVQLRRETCDESWGLQVDSLHPRVVHICNVPKTDTSSNPVSRYNAGVEEPLRIQPGYYIIEVQGMKWKDFAEVDGKKTSELLREKLSRSQDLVVIARLCPPRFLEISFENVNGGKYGMDLSYNNSGRAVVIKNIKDGVVKSLAPELQAGDRIYGVGDMEGSSEELMKALAAQGKDVKLRLSRPAVEL